MTVYLNREKVEINPALMKIKINEMEHVLSDSVLQVRDTEEEIIALIRKTSDGFVELDSPSHLIRVTVSPNEVILLNSPIHRGRLCGLCGSQTGDKLTDLVGPKKCSLPDNLMNVAYELNQPAGCKSSHSPNEQELLRRIQDKCMKEEASTVFGLTDRRPLLPKSQQNVLSMGIRSIGSDCELLRNRMIHRGRKRCFSVEPALKCSPECQPAEFENVKVSFKLILFNEQTRHDVQCYNLTISLLQMGFHCLVNGPLSDELKEAMAIRPLDELAGKEVTTTTVFRVPTSCTPSTSRVEEPTRFRHH